MQAYQGIADIAFSSSKGERPAPKPGAIPTSLYPDIHFSAMIPRRTVKIKIFLSVVIYVVKAAFVPFSATGGKPAIARAARLCGLLSKPRMDRVYALPNQARYQLRYTRIFNFCHYTTAERSIKDNSSYHVSPQKATGAHSFSPCAPVCSIWISGAATPGGG